MNKAVKKLSKLESGTVFSKFTALSNQFNSVNLGQGFPTLPIPTIINKALEKTLSNPNQLLHQYTRSQGHPRLVNALSKLYEHSFGRRVDPMKEIITTVGATEAIYTSINAFIEDGDEVLLMQPFYDSYPASIIMAGGKSVFTSLKPKSNTPMTSNEFVVNFTDLKSKINKNTKMLIINNPHNPLGKVWSKQELSQIADICIENDLLVISDEVYESLVFGDVEHVKIASLNGMWERTITIGSAGKMFGVTGWKIGWCVAHEELINSIQKVHQFVPFSVSTPLQESIAIALERAISPQCDYFDSTRKQYMQLRDELFELLKKYGFDPVLPQGGYFIMAKTTHLNIPLNDDDDENVDFQICRWMTEHIGITAIPPSAFYDANDKKGLAFSGKYARFAYCKTRGELEDARKALEKYFGK